MLVSNLKARTGCQGKAVYLSWDNPPSAAHTRITRRANDWPYYVDDPADVIYDGALISSFADVASTPPLAEDTYYYYTVLTTFVSPSPSLDDYELGEQSRVAGLSIPVMDGKAWIWDKTPMAMKRLDGKPYNEGGGNGDLEKWMTVMGCWLNLIRGYNKAALLNLDDSKAPYAYAKEKNFQWGVTPEDSYDFTVVRKFNEAAAGLYQIKGSCPSLVEVVEIYTGWEAECIDIAATTPVNCGQPMLLRTYDGKTAVKTFVGEDNGLPSPLQVRLRGSRRHHGSYVAAACRVAFGRGQHCSAYSDTNPELHQSSVCLSAG